MRGEQGSHGPTVTASLSSAVSLRIVTEADSRSHRGRGQRSCWEQSGAYAVVWGTNTLTARGSSGRRGRGREGACAGRACAGRACAGGRAPGLGASLPEAGASGPWPLLGGKQEPSVLCPQKLKPHPSLGEPGPELGRAALFRGARPHPVSPSVPGTASPPPMGFSVTLNNV